jgi:hypothetical protein
MILLEDQKGVFATARCTDPEEPVFQGNPWMKRVQALDDIYDDLCGLD